ncbi:MAG: hypothetical protein QOI89_3462 [Solirubrobacteraceae bacterium]|jgi:hypothetical protein|nr:hypothetical protein [Solirubrobacteraceae bacterium]
MDTRSTNAPWGTMWVASLRKACGIAEFALSISEYIPELRLSKFPLVKREDEVLYLQHESMLYSEDAVTDVLLRAKDEGVSVVAAEHDVAPDTRRWEAHADTLIALTANGASTLRERCGEAKVVHIPHGCPTWFPKRKTSIGSTIGAFGFLGHYKGFFGILDVLRSCPGTELILFSHDRRRKIEEDWTQAIKGLPVRWVRDYLSQEEVAQRLAAEADVLVYFYDDVVQYSASGAVRIGLASGVPVLTSKSRWFDELGESVYRTDDLVIGVQRLFADNQLRADVTTAARDFCEENSWPKIGKMHRLLVEERRRV